MRDAVADVLASRARLEPPLSRYVVGSVAAHLLLGAMLVLSTRLTPEPEKRNVINVRLSSGGSAPAPAAPAPAAQRARAATPPPAQPPAAATPVPMTRPVPPPPQTKVAEQPRKAAASETLFGKSNLPVAANPTPTTTAAPVPTKSPSPPAAAPPAPAQPAPPASVPAAGSGTGTAGIGTAPGVGKAGVMGLEGGPFPFSDYLERMIGLIGKRWQRPQTGAEPSATVYFIIDRNGRVRDVEISEPSGIGAFDRAALRAVLESSPLPPLPPGYSGQWLGVHLAFH